MHRILTCGDIIYVLLGYLAADDIWNLALASRCVYAEVARGFWKNAHCTHLLQCMLPWTVEDRANSERYYDLVLAQEPTARDWYAFEARSRYIRCLTMDPSTVSPRQAFVHGLLYPKLSLRPPPSDLRPTFPLLQELRLHVNPITLGSFPFIENIILQPGNRLQKLVIRLNPWSSDIPTQWHDFVGNLFRHIRWSTCALQSLTLHWNADLNSEKPDHWSGFQLHLENLTQTFLILETRELKELSISSVAPESISRVSAGFLSNLRKLHIKYVDTRTLITLIARSGSRSLMNLAIDNLTGTLLLEEWSELMRQVVETSRLLTSLTINFHSFCPEHPHLPQHYLQPLLSLAHIQTLAITNVDIDLDTHVIQRLSVAFPSLSHITLGCMDQHASQRLTLDCLAVLAQHCRKLKFVALPLFPRIERDASRFIGPPLRGVTIGGVDHGPLYRNWELQEEVVRFISRFMIDPSLVLYNVPFAHEEFRFISLRWPEPTYHVL